VKENCFETQLRRVYKESPVQMIVINITGQHTRCIRNQNSWFLFNSMCWIEIWP